MNVRILLRKVLDYIERVARRLRVPVTGFAVDGTESVVPIDGTEEKWFLPLPVSPLTKLLEAFRTQ
jgi:hypothetical protein